MARLVKIDDVLDDPYYYAWCADNGYDPDEYESIEAWSDMMHDAATEWMNDCRFS